MDLFTIGHDTKEETARLQVVRNRPV